MIAANAITKTKSITLAITRLGTLTLESVGRSVERTKNIILFDYDWNSFQGPIKNAPDPQKKLPPINAGLNLFELEFRSPSQNYRRVESFPKKRPTLKPSLTTVFALTASLVLFACSLSPSDRAKIRLEVEGVTRDPLGAIRDPIEFMSAPASVSDMNCIMLNVMGKDIAPEKEISRDTAYDFSSQFPKLLGGDACASYAGALSPIVPLRNGQSVEVYAPVGIDRLVQVLGTKTNGYDCSKNETYVDLLRSQGSAATDALIPDLYEIGRKKVQRLTGDLSLSISNQYQQSSPQQVTHCGNSGDGSGGNTGSLSQKDLIAWFNGWDLAPGPSIMFWNNRIHGGIPGPLSTPGSLQLPSVAAVGSNTAVNFVQNSSTEAMDMGPSNSSGSLNSSDFTFIFALALPSSLAAGTRTLLDGQSSSSHFVIDVLTTGTNAPSSIRIGGTSSSGTLTLGKWHVVTVTRSSSHSGIAEVYLDGVKDSATFSTSDFKSDLLFRLGASITTPNYAISFKGMIGDVVYYNSYLGGTDYLKNSQCFLANRWGIQSSVTGCQ